MNALSVRPPVSQLMFQLFGRPLHPELFDIETVRAFRRADYELRIWITRAGHVLTWENEDVLLTEVAGVGDSHSDKRLLLRHPIRGERSGRVRCGHEIDYHMSFQVETLPEDVYRHVHAEILADGTRRGILHNFQPHHRLAIAPLSFVIVEPRLGSACVSTFHTFPAERTIVKSQTLIEHLV